MFASGSRAGCGWSATTSASPAMMCDCSTVLSLTASTRGRTSGKTISPQWPPSSAIRMQRSPNTSYRTSTFRMNPGGGPAAHRQPARIARRGQEPSPIILQHIRNGVCPINSGYGPPGADPLPIVEMERVDIIKRNFTAIKEALEQEVIAILRRNHKSLRCGAGDSVLSDGKASADGYYLLYIPDEALRNRVRFLHECGTFSPMRNAARRRK